MPDGLMRPADSSDADPQPVPVPAAPATGSAATLPQVRPSRRLSDKVLLAFHQACDEGRLDFARKLLILAEELLDKSSTLPGANWRAEHERRRATDTLVAAHERLWELRHAEGASSRGAWNYAISD
ncbi:hypothetical protein [Roseomonas sp. BN140053]|uniref:hypothetical protein n=1 Tax=Roseomonas sp. BN140053 TaxID=3391898 RepID=UPI0039EB209A